MFKKMFKNQRGLTLIELLAVVVILGIIAAIAIPAIGGMIQNSKIDAHIANAKQIANGARLYATTEPDKLTWTGNRHTVSLSTLESLKHVEPIKDPEGSGSATYVNTTTQVIIEKDSNDRYKYFVKLVGASKTYIDETVTGGVDARNLTRSNYKTGTGTGTGTGTN